MLLQNLFCRWYYSRLYSLQISDREKYELLSDKNRIREWKTPPQRGFITDYFNNVLADNDRVFQVHLDLDQIKDFDDVMFKLKNILAFSNNEIKKIYREKERLKPWDILVASDNLNWAQFSKLNLYLHELEGLNQLFHLQDFIHTKMIWFHCWICWSCESKRYRKKRYN